MTTIPGKRLLGLLDLTLSHSDVGGIRSTNNLTIHGLGLGKITLGRQHFALGPSNCCCVSASKNALLFSLCASKRRRCRIHILFSQAPFS